MARRKRVELDAAAEDDEVCARRASQLDHRLRYALMSIEDPVWDEVSGARLYTSRRQHAALIADPADRLRQLVALADEVRPLLPGGVRRHTLPESLSEWRP